MEHSVKAAMLRSSQQTLALLPTTPASPPRTPSSLRRTRSSNSLDSPRPAPSLAYEFPQPPQLSGHALGGTLTPPLLPFVNGLDSVPPSFSHHLRGASVDIPRSSSQLHLPTNSRVDPMGGKSLKDKAAAKDLSPAKYCNILANTSSTQLEVETVKKLRLLLRNESARYSYITSEVSCIQ